MRTKTEYNWDDDDPFPMGKRIDEAFNRVLEFCPELRVDVEKPSHRPRELVAFNRVTNGEFDMDDLRCLHAYTIRILEAITNKYAGSVGDMAQSVLQAGHNLCNVMTETLTYVMQYPRWKPVPKA